MQFICDQNFDRSTKCIFIAVLSSDGIGPRISRVLDTLPLSYNKIAIIIPHFPICSKSHCMLGLTISLSL